MKKLVIASSNPGKLRELTTLLAPLGIEAVPQADLGVGEAEEPHDTFLENALAKARHASRATGLPALADDSGLCVYALKGEPGVHSAYYAGRGGSREERDARNNAKLVAELAGVEDRRAFYYCVLVLVASADDPTPIVVDGRWEGEMMPAPQGTGGFGYDPYFRTDQRGLTAAQLPPEDKNRLSHRGKALARLASRLAAGGAT
ncbi:MAG TPA: RdgB/HAM1 family non-canonical purine NTP pyrophosphatase [Usitatibacter sp.]|nr:RdgB/HAM1 family non-canonical purine NTP pyrophosphatase [Usitatibacter sp.]